MQLLLHLLAFFDDVGVSVIINCPLGGLTFIPREREVLGVDKVEVITFIVTLFPFLFSVQLSFFLFMNGLQLLKILTNTLLYFPRSCDSSSYWNGILHDHQNESISDCFENRRVQCLDRDDADTFKILSEKVSRYRYI